MLNAVCEVGEGFVYMCETSLYMVACYNKGNQVSQI